jgi:tetratricopeptide (TPR) repeat protein
MSQGNRRRLYRGLALALGLFLILAAGVAAWRFLFPSPPPDDEAVARSAPPDPRLAYQGPYQNVHPDVAFVGSKRCGECHSDIARSYARHPMARTLMPIAELAESQVYEGHHNPFQALNCFFAVQRQGKKVYHRGKMVDWNGKPVFEMEQEVHFAVGSGNHGHSYITNRDGFLFQTAISWYERKKGAAGDSRGMWDVSAGDFQATLDGRPIGPECLFCHSNRARHRPGSWNAYEKPIFAGHGIGCERCHGPGDKHVRDPGQFQPAPWSPKNVRIDPTIVHPGKLPPALREAVCQQCHLEGAARVLPYGRELYDFRPGLPLEQFWSIFVRGSGLHQKTVNHVEQMYQSVCFQRSSENHKLGCISCHDPHYRVPADERAAYFRQRCLQCHKDAEARGERQEAGESPKKMPGPVSSRLSPLAPRLSLAGCSLPPARRPDNNCIDCHMRSYAPSDIAHAVATDHRISRKPDLELPEGLDIPPDDFRKRSRFPVVHFQRGPVPENDPDLARDLGIGLVMSGSLAHALPLLDAAVRRYPDDLQAALKRGMVLGLFLKRKTEALACFEKILAEFPEHEHTLFLAAKFHQELGHADQALELWRRAMTVAPYRTPCRAQLVEILLLQEKWQEALRESREMVRLDPLNLEVRKLLIQCLVRTGDPATAQAEFNRVEAVRPDNLDNWRGWFARVRRAAGK